MQKIGLILEGGAMRGIYTAGVLDYFMKQNLYFPYVIGVSAGACQACSYLSRQKGRNKRVTMEFIGDPRYLSYRNLIKQGGVFGLDFMFHDIAEKLIPFDFSAFEASEQEFVIGVTNCVTGEPEYYYKSQNQVGKMFQACTASSSMPLVAKEVVMDGKAFMDGGISDAIPVRKALEDGCDKVVVVLTRNQGYRKKISHASIRLARLRYPNYSGMVEKLKKRAEIYNDTIEYVEKMEQEGRAFLIRPSQPVIVSRTERNKKRLFDFYKEGYVDAKNNFEKMRKWMEKKNDFS